MSLGFSKILRKLVVSMYLPILRVHLKKKKKKSAKDSTNDAYAMFSVVYFWFSLEKHIFWVLIWIALTSQCNSDGYPQHNAFIKKYYGQKKLIIRFSGHFWQKQMRQAGIFFFYSWNRRGNFFFYYTNRLKGLVSWNAFYSNITIKILNFWTPRHS